MLMEFYHGKRLRFFVFFMVVCLIVLGACDRKKAVGKLQIDFDIVFDGSPLSAESIYTITSGNNIKIEDVQYFVSDIVLVDMNGNRHALPAEKDGAHYVDWNLPNTLSWTLESEIPTGVFSGIEWVFGLDEKGNYDHRFPNQPEINMYWPAALGGGYHYMKINGRWQVQDTLWDTFGFHAGIGQRWENGEAVEFYQNYVVLRDTLDFAVTDGGLVKLRLSMDVFRWFHAPHVWDFNYFGGKIMQNQEAQTAIKENAPFVFSWSRQNDNI